MDDITLNRRELLALAATIPILGVPRTEEPSQPKAPPEVAKAVDPFAADELPIQGSAGECSGWT